MRLIGVAFVRPFHLLSILHWPLNACAKMCKISVHTLVHIEHGEGNQTLKSLNAVFRPFGLQMGVVKLRRQWG